MALFQFSEKSQAQPNELQKPPQIESSVLTNLNLTQAEIDSHYKNQQLETVKKEVAEQASAYYAESSSGGISYADPKPIKLGEIALKPKVQEISDIPDSLYSQFREIEVAMHPDHREQTKVYLDTFVDTFGQKALDRKDWKTAVKAYDLTTEGGIIQKPEVIKKFGEIYASDVETRRQIAELIQQRIDMKKQAPDASTAARTPASEKPAAAMGYPQISRETPAIPPTIPKQPETPSTNPQMPMPENVFSMNRMAASKTTPPQPVGTPTSPILGETTLTPNISGLREAPPNPNPLSAQTNPLAKAA